MCVFDGSCTLQDWMVWEKHPVRSAYDVVMDLGEGAFSQVVLARHKVKKNLVALKVVYLLNPELDDEHRAVMKREAEFLNMLDSPRIVECLDVVNDGRQEVLILEYLRGGQLYDSLHRLGGSDHPYTEQAAAAIFAQMAEAVAFLHEYGIMHRDIKGENFVFAEDPAHAAANIRAPSLKLIDLGMAAMYNPKAPVRGALGSPGFVSPEAVHDEPHMPAMDIFSLGVVAFVMLVGRKPFSVTDSESLRYCKMDIKDAPGLKDPRWLDLSASAKDLLMGMLRYNTNHRLTAQQVVEHHWVVTKGGAQAKPLADSVTTGAANVAALRRLRNMAHGVVAVNRVSQALAPDDARKKAATDFSRSRAAQQRSKGYRNDPSGRGISKLDRMALKATSATAARIHDRGGTVDPEEDISVHYRSYRGYASQHGGSAFYQGRKGSNSGENLHQRSLKHSGSAIMLSEMEQEGSYHGGLLHPSQSAAVLRRSSMGRSGSLGPPPATLASAIGSSLRSFVGGSVHGGSMNSSSDKEDRSRSGRWGMKRGSSHSLVAMANNAGGSVHGGNRSVHGGNRSVHGSVHGGSRLVHSIEAGNGSWHSSFEGSAHSKGKGGRLYPDLPIYPSKGRVHRVEPLPEGRASQEQPRSPSRPVPVTAMQQLEGTRHSG